MKFLNSLTRVALVGTFLLCSIVMNAQIKGKITSSEDNSPLPGASVVVKGTTKGSLTDLEGLFNIDAKVGETLVISFVGYEPMEISTLPVNSGITP